MDLQTLGPSIAVRPMKVLHVPIRENARRLGVAAHGGNPNASDEHKTYIEAFLEHNGDGHCDPPKRLTTSSLFALKCRFGLFGNHQELHYQSASNSKQGHQSLRTCDLCNADFANP